MSRRTEARINVTFEAAARWLDRRSDASWTPVDEAAFQAWILEDPERRLAYAKVALLWNDPALSGALATMPDAIEPQPSTSRLIAAFAALAACIAGIAFMTLAEQTPTTPPYEQLASTAPRLHKTMSLPDGSTLHLNAGATAEISFADDARRVRLQSGEAFFEVAKDARRPFEVATQHGSVTVTGTRFNVDTFAEGVEVTVGAGSVKIRAPNGETVSAEAGQRLAIQAGALGELRNVHPGAAEAWRTGWLETDGMPLSRLVERLAREGGMTVYSIDPKLQALEIAGRFRTDNPEALLGDLGAIHGFTVRETPRGLWLEPA